MAQSRTSAPRGSPPAEDRSQAETVSVPRLRDLAHHLQGRRRNEGVANPVLSQQGESAFRIEFPKGPGNDRESVMPGRQQHVHEAGHPGPVRRSPEAVSRLRGEVVGKFDSGQMAQQRAVGVQSPLGRARGSRRIDQQCRVFGPGPHRREGAPCPGQQLVEAVKLAGAALGHDNNQLQRRQPASYGGDLVQVLGIHEPRPWPRCRSAGTGGRRGRTGRTGEPPRLPAWRRPGGSARLQGFAAARWRCGPLFRCPGT